MLDDLIPAPERGSVQRRLLQAARSSVQFAAVREQQIERRNGALLNIGGIVVAARIGVHRSHARSRHRGRHALVIGQIDDGAVFEQQLDGRRILRFCRAQQRRCADGQHAIHAAIRAGGAIRRKELQLKIGIRSLVEQYSNDVDRQRFIERRAGPDARHAAACCSRRQDRADCGPTSPTG